MEPVEQSVHIMRAYLARTSCRSICYSITEVNPLYHQFRLSFPRPSSTAAEWHGKYRSFLTMYKLLTLDIENGLTVFQIFSTNILKDTQFRRDQRLKMANQGRQLQPGYLF